MKLEKVKKIGISLTVAATMVAPSLTSITASAASDYEIAFPTESMSVETTDSEGREIMTTLTQRAASEIPLIFGVNVISGNMFSGLQYLAGTSVNENPDPYLWNYNYMQETGKEDLPKGTYYENIGNDLTNPNGLYQSGGGNQAYGQSVESLGGVGYAVGYRTDVVFSFNSILVDQIDWVRSLKPGDTYYQEGDENYSPLLADVQTAGVSARLYSWTDLGSALSAYLEEHTDLTTRYDDPEIIGNDVAQFSAGIPYYIASLIADGTIEKKTAAYVSAIDEYTLTCTNPAAAGNVAADVYAEVCNFNYITGDYTIEKLMEEDVDLIILAASGYGYANSGNSGGATGGVGGPGGGGAANTSSKLDILNAIEALGYTADETPLVMDSNTVSVQLGNNGYNFSPITPMFMPYVQTYAYMDELAEVNEAINPVAMVVFMMDELAHVTDEACKDVALYYIGSKWDSVDSEYDRVPDLENYVYDKDAIIDAIYDGVNYALSGEAEENGNYLMPAYRATETAYQLLTESSTTEIPEEGHDYVTVEVNGVTKYLDLTALIASDSDDADDSEDDSESDGNNEFNYDDIRTSYEAIIDYYNTSEYGYGDDLQTTLQNYADHMVLHVWEPDLSVEGSYVYDDESGDDEVVIEDGLTDTAAEDGNWYYYTDGEVNTSYTGFAENKNGSWYVENGRVTFKTNSVIKDTTGAIGTKGSWYYVVGSKVRTDYTNVANYKNANGWWYIKNGKVDFTYTGFASNKNGSWYVEKGQVKFNKNSVIKDTKGTIGTKGTWYYVVGSKVQTSYTGVANYKNANGWWYIKNGKVDFSANTVAKNKNGWWYVVGGKVQFDYTGVANYKNANGWWYIKKGKVDFTYTGKAKNKNGTWNVVKGKVVF